ncbi:MAG: TIGR03915 family putative DNA repair protein [Clostridia bacterium]
MKILLIEPCFAGFLTAIYHAHYSHKDADIITSDLNAPSFLDIQVEITTDTVLAARVRSGIIKRAGTVIYSDIAHAYLSCQDTKEKILFAYTKLVLLHGRAAYGMYQMNEVKEFNDLLQKVRGEAHRFKGFLRFKELKNGIYYSAFSGDNDIIELLLPHFRARMNAEKFVLHDIKRHKLIYYDSQICHYLIAPEEYSVTLSDEEAFFSALWKDYHKNIAVEGRLNTDLQRQCLPKKYRWFMNEF